MTLITCDASPLGDADAASLGSIANRMRRTLRAHGATAAGDEEARRRWTLDPCPLVVETNRWERLATGLSQRARALNLITADVLGPQRLLASGLLPTAAVLQHDSYLRPCIGFQTQSGTGRHLAIVGSDVVTDRDGRFVVVGDHTEAPSGAGMALENRDVMSQPFAESMTNAGVRRLGDWFDTMRGAMADLAPIGESVPRTAILTPGPFSRAYFEHSLLARTLGFTLVQPADLTVRHGRVWLKSLRGLEPVHVLMRHVLSGFCDPLELRGDSLLGVPGLVEATRRGSVVHANSLGSGVAENPAVFAAVNTIIRVVMGEEPLLATPESRWCGETAALDWAMAQPDALVFRPINPTDALTPVAPANLASADRSSFLAAVRARPHRWVAQEVVDATESECFVDDAITWRPTLTRTFSVAVDSDYRCLSGGVSLSATDPFELVARAPRPVKDTWIIDGVAGAHQPPTIPRARVGAVDLRDSVTSRAAEEMYWLGRNMERSDALIRTVRATVVALEAWPELASEGGGTWLDRCCALLDTLTGMVPLERYHVDVTTFFATVDAALGDQSRPQSLIASLHNLSRNAQSVRELFGTDWWRLIAGVAELSSQLTADQADAIDIANAIQTPLLALNGLFADAMVRDPGWSMLEIGRRLERSLLLVSFLDAALVAPTTESIEPALHELVLTAWDSIVAYRRRYRSDIELTILLDLLIADTTNPRSVRTQLDRVRTTLTSLPGDSARLVVAMRHLSGALDGLDRLAADERADEPDQRGRLSELAVYLATTRSQILATTAALELELFAQVDPVVVVGAEWPT